jgi:uncharacterized integral membrane protein
MVESPNTAANTQYTSFSSAAIQDSPSLENREMPPGYIYFALPESLARRGLETKSQKKYIDWEILLGMSHGFEYMKLVRIIVGEILLLGASILIFRSVWTLLDQYLGASNLWPMLIIGIVVTIAGLIIINHEVECQMNEMKKHS